MCKSLALALTLVSASICASPVLAEDAPKATEHEKEQTAQTPEKETPVPDAPPAEMSQTQQENDCLLRSAQTALSLIHI